MAVVVVIRRTFTSQEKAEQLAPIIVQLRSQASIQPGYISGKTLRCLDCAGEFMVLSTWNKLSDWETWLNSDTRKIFQNQIDELLGEKTEYSVFEPLVGGIIPKFVSPEQSVT